MTWWHVCILTYTLIHIYCYRYNNFFSKLVKSRLANSEVEKVVDKIESHCAVLTLIYMLLRYQFFFYELITTRSFSLGS